MSFMCILIKHELVCLSVVFFDKMIKYVFIICAKWWAFSQRRLLKTKNRVNLSAVSADDEKEMSHSTSCF